MAMTVADMANVNDEEVASSGGRRCPTTAMTVTDAANVDDGEVASGGRNSSKRKIGPHEPPLSLLEPTWPKPPLLQRRHHPRPSEGCEARDS
jgi:hypothetical protein